MKELFLLDPTVTFFNHGSFGACPKPIFDEYQRWQIELERQPVEFLIRRYPQLMHDARAALAGFLGCGARDLVYIPNATTGVNIAARSIELKDGEEVLATDLEYGALDRMWESITRDAGATYVRAPVKLPVMSAEEFIAGFWRHVTPQTRLIFISHITSATGLVLPARQIIDRARDEGIPVLVDGAHVPGQLDLDLSDFGADFYTGNCHKWMLTPKGSAFLYVRPELQHLIKPLVISWGTTSLDDSAFIQDNEYQGTRDISGFLAVPRAIEFLREHDWPAVRARCREQTLRVRKMFVDIFGGEPLAPADSGWYAQLVAHEVPVPAGRTDLGPLLQRELYDRHRVEIPVTSQNGRVLIRASLQAYIDETDIQKLDAALRDVWPSILENA